MVIIVHLRPLLTIRKFQSDKGIHSSPLNYLIPHKIPTISAELLNNTFSKTL